MAGLTSGTSENQLELYVTGGSLGDNKLSLRISREHTFSIEEDALTRLFELKAMTPEALQADPASLTETMLLPLAIDMNQTTTVALSPELVTFLADRFGADIPATLSFHTRSVDNVVYIRLADYTVFGVQPEWMPEWIGIQTRVILSDAVASSVASPEFNVQDAQDALVAPGAALSNGVIYHVPPQQMAAYADFMRLTSLGTSEVNGKPVKIVHLTWDIPRYLGSPLFAQHTGIFATSGEPNPPSLLLGILGTVLLDGFHAQMTQTVGVEDSYLYAVETQITWALGLPGGLPLAERPTIGVTNTTLNRDLNAVASIPAPEGAVVLPIDTILQIVNLVQR
jgi:hypothetical protein